jgi:hypothetical protein
MQEFVKSIIRGQFEAALCMLNECLRNCPEEHWDGKIANDTFRQVVYHTLFYVDVYTSPNESAFALRELHARGGDERTPKASAGLSKEESLAYLETCRQKAIESFAAETVESLEGPSGFSWLPFSRGEVHLYNIRHIQHHTGQLSAYLRRIVQATESWWVRTGWR